MEQVLEAAEGTGSSGGAGLDPEEGCLIPRDKSGWEGVCETQGKAGWPSKGKQDDQTQGKAG